MRRHRLLRIDLPAGAGRYQPTVMIVTSEWLH
jgi:hypothetical protein